MASDLTAARAAKRSMEHTANDTGAKVSALYRQIVGATPSPDAVSNFVRAALPVLRRGHSSAQSLAKAHHRQFRRAAGVKGSVKIPAGAAFNAEQAESSLRFVGFVEPARRDSAVLDLPFVNSAPDKTYDAVDGAAARRVVQSGMDMARAAAEADKAAIGWARVTQGADACYFCSMLESRGMVYDADSFDVVDSRFLENSLPPTVLSGELTAKTHDHCRCVLVPVFSRTSDIQKNADSIYATWKTVQRDYAWLRRSAGVDMIQIWRWYWDGSLASVAEKWAGVG